MRPPAAAASGPAGRWPVVTRLVIEIGGTRPSTPLPASSTTVRLRSRSVADAPGCSRMVRRRLTWETVPPRPGGGQWEARPGPAPVNGRWHPRTGPGPSSGAWVHAAGAAGVAGCAVHAACGARRGRAVQGRLAACRSDSPGNSPMRGCLPSPSQRSSAPGSSPARAHRPRTRRSIPPRHATPPCVSRCPAPIPSWKQGSRCGSGDLTANSRDSGRFCSAETLGSVYEAGVTEVRFGGGIWEAGERGGIQLGAFEGDGLTPALMAEEYRRAADASRRTEAAKATTLEIDGRPAWRIDVVNGNSPRRSSCGARPMEGGSGRRRRGRRGGPAPGRDLRVSLRRVVGELGHPERSAVGDATEHVGGEGGRSHQRGARPVHLERRDQLPVGREGAPIITGRGSSGRTARAAATDCPAASARSGSDAVNATSSAWFRARNRARSAAGTSAPRFATVQPASRRAWSRRIRPISWCSPVTPARTASGPTRLSGPCGARIRLESARDGLAREMLFGDAPATFFPALPHQCHRAAQEPVEHLGP